MQLNIWHFPLADVTKAASFLRCGYKLNPIKGGYAFKQNIYSHTLSSILNTLMPVLNCSGIIS